MLNIIYNITNKKDLRLLIILKNIKKALCIGIKILCWKNYN